MLSVFHLNSSRFYGMKTGVPGPPANAYNSVQACRASFQRKTRLIRRHMTNDERDILTGAMRKLPMMPIREMVIFPHMMTPFVVGRESSVRALEEALNGDRRIFLATQHDASVDEPTADDIFTVGVIGNIVQSVRMPDGNIKVLVEGVERGRAIEVNDDDGFFVATVRTSKAELQATAQAEQLVSRVHQLFEQYNKLQQSLNQGDAAALRT